MIPALLVGMLMFVAGAAFGFLVLLPQALPILFSFQTEGLENLITYSEYFSFVVQLMLAMGLSFEIPLVIMLLTALGIVVPESLNRFRRFAMVLACCRWGDSIAGDRHPVHDPDDGADSAALRGRLRGLLADSSAPDSSGRGDGRSCSWSASVCRPDSPASSPVKPLPKKPGRAR